MPEDIRQVIEEILQKEYKIAYGEYIVTKCLKGVKRFEDMDYKYMFDYFKREFEDYRDEISSKFNIYPDQDAKQAN